MRNTRDQHIISALVEFFPQGFELAGAVGEAMEEYDDMRGCFSPVQKYQTAVRDDVRRIGIFQGLDSEDAFFVAVRGAGAGC